MIVLSPYLQEQWADRDVFEVLAGLTGKIHRLKDGRKTFQTTIGGKDFFVKVYLGISWINLLTSILRFRLPVLNAENEWKAIQRLEELGIDTMTLAGYGKRGYSPAHRQSFVITDELSPTLSLENFCRNWPASPPDPAMKRSLITRVARIARTLHENNMIHRDFYICHFLLDLTFENSRELRLHLIDLHRMKKPFLFRTKNKIKDIAALYFSSMDIGLTQRDRLRFIRAYRNQPLKKALAGSSFWRRVSRRAAALRAKPKKG